MHIICNTGSSQHYVLLIKKHSETLPIILFILLLADGGVLLHLPVNFEMSMPSASRNSLAITCLVVPHIPYSQASAERFNCKG